MQTYITKFGFINTATSLDDARLAQQRYDALDLLNQVVYGEGDYEKHPATYMWQNNPRGLVAYGISMCTEWTFGRGFDDASVYPELQKISLDLEGGEWSRENPPWKYDKDLIRSHRSNLLMQDRSYYGKTFHGAPDLMPLLWPVTSGDGTYDLMVSKADKERIAKGERVLPKDVAKRVSNL